MKAELGEPGLAGAIPDTHFTRHILSMKASAWYRQTLLLFSLEGCLVSHTDSMAKPTQP